MTMASSGRLLSGTLRLRLKVVLALYVLAAALMPLGHHDLACHLKSPTHCTTCTVGSSAEAAVDPAVLARFWLLDLGAAAAESFQAPDVPYASIPTGRAPPSLV
jgi:hypothetical protein